MDPSKLTPAMKQFYEAKQQYPDCLIMFRMGDFYEMFYEDARKASEILEITLTSRGKGEKKAPLAGIPFHALEPYLGKLVKAGVKVAICEQLEDPKKAKGIVKRGVVRVVTPGTVIEDSALDSKTNNYIMSLYTKEDKFAVAICDVSTGEFLVCDCNDFDKLVNEIVKFNPSECVVPLTLQVNKSLLNKVKKFGCFVNYYDDKYFIAAKAEKTLQEQFETNYALDGLVLSAAGALVSYLHDTQMVALKHINKIKRISTTDSMILDSASIRNLEIFRNIRDGSSRGTLLSVLDNTSSSMGSRRLKKWIREPLMNVNLINERLLGVKALFDSSAVREEVVALLKQITDIERLITRVNYGTCNPRDVVSLRTSLSLVPKINVALDVNSSLLLKLKEFGNVNQVVELLNFSLKDECPVSVREGGFIRDGYSAELDELRNISVNGKGYLADLEAREREKTGIKNLKISFNRVFGYFIEVTKSQLSLVPDNYIRKQTQANSERYITEELKVQEDKILGAQEKINILEYDLFLKLIEKLKQFTTLVQSVADKVADIDVLCSLAKGAMNNNYVMPIVNEGVEIVLDSARHPVIEQETNFVSNDVDLSLSEMMIITGPNMSGKSTFLRQVALITLMAQIGSFVPCNSAKISVVDRIFTRVGAYDDLASGQSTFMVEMSETASILNNATAKSLIIIDELGRGTSTFDGVSIAWSVAEYIYNNIKAKTLMATHYHIMNKLSENFERIKNYNVAVKESSGDVVFLHKIIEGGTDKSYGVHVAKLAGMPKDVVERAKAIQSKLEEEDEMVKKIKAKKLKEQKTLEGFK
jgi:DNA mismatch repair protein MutS